MFGFKIITQGERDVVFRFGRMLPGTRKPGLTWVNPFTDRLRKVNMQIVVVAVPAQEPSPSTTSLCGWTRSCTTGWSTRSR